MHGVNMITCICKSRPAKDFGLQTPKEDCFFATNAVDDMTNSQKRCMIYWWYATNTYSICGKRQHLMLPDCLIQMVRNTYPELDGNYTGFAF